jgi:hypothetical protein
MNIFEKLYRNAVFFIGDVKRLDSFPWITWASNKHKVHFEELLEALPLIRHGDVGIHRDEGYLSNIAIPGFMKHAWIHTDDCFAEKGTISVKSSDDLANNSPMIVEAISEGVVYRSALYPMYSDYAIILRPLEVSTKSCRGACKKAKGIIGTRYDHNFKFDIENELIYYNGADVSKAKEELGAGLEHMQKYDHGFSCTEVVSYAWWHEREKLRLYREKSRGKDIILADSFLNGGFEIVWMSKSITVDCAKKMGLHEEGIEMIKKYLSR